MASREYRIKKPFPKLELSLLSQIYTLNGGHAILSRILEKVYVFIITVPVLSLLFSGNAEIAEDMDISLSWLEG